jgi:uncharacterized protein YutE (UPF0331/DUF86 family)
LLIRNIIIKVYFHLDIKKDFSKIKN